MPTRARRPCSSRRFSAVTGRRRHQRGRGRGDEGQSRRRARRCCSGRPTSTRRRSTAPRRSTGPCAPTTCEMADLLIRAGANVSAANREGVTPMQLAAINGNAAMIVRLIKAGADPNAPLTRIRRHGAHDGGAHREDRRDRRAARRRREGQRRGDLGRHDGADVGRVRAPSGGRQGAHRPRRGRQRAFAISSPAANGRGFEGRTPVGAAARSRRRRSSPAAR